MQFKIISTFTVFHDGQMIVCNAGQTVEAPEEALAGYVRAGFAEPVKAKKGKAEPVNAPVAEPAADTAAIEEAPIA